MRGKIKIPLSLRSASVKTFTDILRLCFGSDTIGTVLSVCTICGSNCQNLFKI